MAKDKEAKSTLHPHLALPRGVACGDTLFSHENLEGKFSPCTLLTSLAPK
ncbi:uncharacterized protein G2W53_007135 [Senna tora]|uniref:Uncharacterized protein n=1 Tax=Senna tora TaxID=362788 RepID=A0A834X5M7_9FABA|nr:uncharacterized protein G2W53_007135 [Senna tora]